MRLHPVLLATVCTLAPLAARAQAPFAGPAQDYTFRACEANLPAVCVAGSASAGLATNAAGNAFYQAVLRVTTAHDLATTPEFRYGLAFVNYAFTDALTGRRNADGESVRFGTADAFGASLYTPLSYAPAVVAPGSLALTSAFLDYGYADPRFPGRTTGSLLVTFTATPEPSTLALAAAGLAFAGTVARRRQR